MWIPMPKVASSSMSVALGPKANCDLVFAFIRHPIERLNSALAFMEPDLSRKAAYFKLHDNYHVRPQSERLKPFDGHIDFIGRYDRLDDDWSVIMEALGVGALGHLNRGAESNWRDHDWSFVGGRYDEDFKLWSC